MPHPPASNSPRSRRRSSTYTSTTPSLFYLCFHFVYTTCALVVLRAMSAFINAAAERIDYFVDSRRPLDTDGARPRSGVVQMSVSKVEGLAVSPPLKPNDLVSACVETLDSVRRLIVMFLM